MGSSSTLFQIGGLSLLGHRRLEPGDRPLLIGVVTDAPDQSLYLFLVLVLAFALLALASVVRRSIGELEREKTQLRTLFESLTEGVVIVNAIGRMVQCNSQAETILGLSRSQLLGKALDRCWQAFHEDGSPYQDSEHPAMVTLASGRPIREAVMGLRLSGGELRWLTVNTQPILDSNGQPTMVVVSFADVTNIRQQKDRLDLTISGAGLGTWDWNVATGQVVFNDNWAQMLGYELSEVAPHVSSWENIVDPAASREVMILLAAHLQGKTPIYRSEHRLRRKDGSWMWVLDTGRVVQRDSDGRPLRALGVHVDITLTKEMEQRLRESDQRFLAIFDQTAHLLWVLTPDGVILNANQSALRFSDGAIELLQGTVFWQSAWLATTAGQSDAMRAAIARAAGGDFERFELAVYLPGDPHAHTPHCYFDFSIKPVWDANGHVTSLVAEALDITEAVHTREGLRIAQERLVHATRNANLGVWDWNPQTDEAWFNEQWFSMLGYDSNEFPHTGHTWQYLMHPEDVETSIATLSRYLNGDMAHKHAEFRLEFRMRCRDGSWSSILSIGRVTERSADGQPIRVCGVHFDETERKRMQSERAQAQRLESIGQLAAGVAHEINTPMQFVSDNLEYLIDGIDSAHRVIDVIEKMVEEAAENSSGSGTVGRLEKTLADSAYRRFRQQSYDAARDCRDGCQRVVSIVHAMGQLSHPSQAEFHLSDLNAIISGAVTVTRNRWKFVADVRLELDPDLPSIPCRAAELSQVFVNLLVNASDAIPVPQPTDPLHGIIQLRTRLVDHHVEAVIEDNGSGIPASIVDRIFDPFFTTKAVGKGTGQGLSIAHDIVVNRHHGGLRVVTQPGKGTTFILELPLTQAVPECT